VALVALEAHLALFPEQMGLILYFQVLHPLAVAVAQAQILAETHHLLLQKPVDQAVVAGTPKLVALEIRRLPPQVKVIMAVQGQAHPLMQVAAVVVLGPLVSVPLVLLAETVDQVLFQVFLAHL
jgi:hypothetical protein